MKHDDGGAAFPHSTQFGSQGMSLRDHFASEVVQVVYAELAPYAAKLGDEWAPAVARATYALADAMLAERAKP